MSFSFKKLDIPDVILTEPKSFEDERGYFLENYNKLIFDNNGISTRFIQDNFSYSKKNVLRGLHFQKNPKEQAKLVTVFSGEIFDVAVDLRQNSLTYGKWVGEILSAQNHKSLYIPEGFAHGFCVLSNEATVSYKINKEYSSEHESGVIWNDPELNISWPISEPILSKKDRVLPFLRNITSSFD